MMSFQMSERVFLCFQQHIRTHVILTVVKTASKVTENFSEICEPLKKILYTHIFSFYY